MAVVRPTCQWLAKFPADPCRVAVSFDIANAFKRVGRSVVLSQIRAHSPQLAHWADLWCSASGETQQGVRHGCFFALASLPALTCALAETAKDHDRRLTGARAFILKTQKMTAS